MLRAKGLGEKRQLVRVVRISLACEQALGSSGRKREQARARETGEG